MEGMTTLLLGIGFFVLGIIATYFISKKKLKCTEEMDAEIVGVKRSSHKSSNHNRRTDYSPIVKYTVNGTEYSDVADIDSINPNKFKEGETIKIKYNPEKPEQFTVKGKAGNLKWSVFFILLGILFIVFYFAK